MHSVVAATEDLLRFILSEKGQRVRVFLVRDIIGAADAYFQDEVVGCMFSENPEARDTLDSEVFSLSFTHKVGLGNSKQNFTIEATKIGMLIHELRLETTSPLK